MDQDSIRRLDITEDVCPLTFVRVKLLLEAMLPGEIAEIRLSGAEPLHNVPRAAAEAGHAILSVADSGNGVHLLRIRRG
jgi:tRNA 2-thiouridine synthesizing protein A